jgi:predicted nucleotidyltransferase
MPGSTSTVPNASPVEELSNLLSCEWENITLAQRRTGEILERLSGAIASVPGPESDTSFVVNGSLARYECTEGSDLDWTLLVDSQANADHQENLLGIRDALNATNREGNRAVFQDLGLKNPGAEGTFGTLVFSQPLIHYIGGENDSNSNTTRRILLLLEAIPIGKRREAFDRVRKNILKRYLVEDKGLFHQSPEGELRWIPLFLLNDIARYWRTMAVDFAYKQFNRGGKGYAIRSIKLGTSRKLLYASGLLACFWCDPAISNLDNLEPKTQNLIDRLEVFLSRTPLERFAAFFVANIPQNNSTFLGECAKNLFDSYNEFLGLLNDEQKRDDLEKLSLAEQDGSEVFAEARRIRHKFRLAMQDTFTGSQSPLRDHAIAKGIF